MILHVGGTMTASNVYKVLSDTTDYLTRISLIWFFGEVAYAVLPIITLALINKMTNFGFNDFLLTKEWSFANIVLLGMSLRKMIYLKVHVQRAPKSFTLDVGTQLIALTLVGAV